MPRGPLPPINAIVTTHLRQGYWNYKGGYELNIAYIAVALAVALAGPGAWSLDRVVGWDDKLQGPVVTAIAACAACGLSFATLVFARHRGAATQRAKA